MRAAAHALVALLLASACAVAVAEATVGPRQALWRGGDPSDGACASPQCAGPRCNVSHSDTAAHGCYCSCGYAMYGGPQLAVTKAGTLLSMVEGRKHPWDAGDEGSGTRRAWHDILLKRSTDSGACAHPTAAWPRSPVAAAPRRQNSPS